MKCITEFLQTFSEGINRRKSSKGIIIYNNKILIVRIQTGCHAEGIWDLPGGGIEENETPIDALKREVKEETNLDLDPNSIKRLDYNTNFDIPEDGVHAKWIYFKAVPLSSNVVLNPAKWLHGQSEHSEYKWLDSLEELNNLDMCDEHKTILKKTLKNLIKKVNK